MLNEACHTLGLVQRQVSIFFVHNDDYSASVPRRVTYSSLYHLWCVAVLLQQASYYQRKWSALRTPNLTQNLEAADA